MNEMTKLALYKGKYKRFLLPMALIIGVLFGTGQVVIGAVALVITVFVSVKLFNKWDRPTVRRSNG